MPKPPEHSVSHERYSAMCSSKFRRSLDTKPQFWSGTTIPTYHFTFLAFYTYVL